MERAPYDWPTHTEPEFLIANGRFAPARAFIKAILCIYASFQLRSFDNNGIVHVANDTLKRANSRNYHHFFPRAYLKKIGVTDSEAYLWDPKLRAIVAGADKLEALSDADRARSLTALSERVRALTAALDDVSLVEVAAFMIDDLYQSHFCGFRWTAGVHEYTAATAGVFMQELTKRGFVLHYVVDNTQGEADLDEMLAFVPTVFSTAGLFVVGPQLMALEAMEKIDHRPRDVTAIPFYRAEGHHLADELIKRCHRERRSSVYLNLDLDDDAPGLSMDVALSQGGTAGAIVVFRNQLPLVGTEVQIAAPAGMTLPMSGAS